jgi:hypothetical protein
VTSWASGWSWTVRGFWMLELPDGSKIEVFGPDSDINRHFTTGPVAGFLVDDIQGATADEFTQDPASPDHSNGAAEDSRLGSPTLSL